MKAPSRQLDTVLKKLIRRKNERDSKSLFDLLLLIEQKIRTRVRKDIQSRIKKHEAVIKQRQPAIFKLSRYVE